MTTYSRSSFLHLAAMLASAILVVGYAGPVSAQSPSVSSKALAQASGENTLARCQQLFGLLSRHNTDGYARPLDARMALEDCQKGDIASGVATLKRALERAQIAVPPIESPPAADVANAAPTPSDPKARCDQLTSYFDRYGVGRGEDSDGARNHTRIAAGIDASRASTTRASRPWRLC